MSLSIRLASDAELTATPTGDGLVRTRAPYPRPLSSRDFSWIMTPDQSIDWGAALVQAGVEAKRRQREPIETAWGVIAEE